MKISTDKQKKLELYADLLLKWNKSINLIGKTTETDLWHRHIEDSLQLKKLIPDNTNSICDLGSGAGLPGVILSVVFPDKRVHLVEANQKKVSFLQEVARHLKLENLQIHNGRIEKLIPWKNDVITARALAALPDLLEFSQPFFGKNSLFLFLKGKDAEEEIRKSFDNWEFRHILHPSKTDKSGHIIEIRDLSRK